MSELRELPLQPGVADAIANGEIKRAVRAVEVVFLDGDIRCFADYRSFTSDGDILYFQWDQTGEFAGRREDLSIPKLNVRWWNHLNLVKGN